MTLNQSPLLRKIVSFVVAAVLLTGISGCSSLTDPDTQLPSLFSVFATLKSHNDKGAVFIVNDGPDSEPITLTTAADLTREDFVDGQRYIIIYANGDTYNPYIPGTIDLKNVLPVANGKVTVASKDEIDRMVSTEYVVNSLFRTGDFVNVELRVSSTATPTVFGLYADRATLSNPLPDLYLVYETRSTGLSSTSAFGSFDISSVWDLETCQGVNIDLHDQKPVRLLKKSE